MDLFFSFFNIGSSSTTSVKHSQPEPAVASPFLLTRPSSSFIPHNSLVTSPSPSPVWTRKFLVDQTSDDLRLDLPQNSSNWTFPGDFYDQQTVLIQIMDDYILPVVMLLGILGNTLSLIVYVSTPRLCRQTSSVYLAFLSGVDNAYLLFYCMVWFNFIGINIYHQNGWCQTIFYSMYVCNFLAAWTVVSFTGERWIIVFRPLLRRSLCTRKRAFKNMIFLTILALIMYSYSLLTVFVEDQYPDKPVCMESIRNEIISLVIKTLNIIATIIVPLVAIVTMNASIAIEISKYARISYKGKCQQIYDRNMMEFIKPDSRRLNELHVNFYSEFAERQFLTVGGMPSAAPSGCTAATPAAASADAVVIGLQSSDVASKTGKTSSSRPNEFRDRLECRKNDHFLLTKSRHIGRHGNEGGRTDKRSSSACFSDAAKGLDFQENMENSTRSDRQRHNLRLKTKRHHTQLHITRSLLLVSSVFILLNLPSYAFHICGLVMRVSKKLGIWDDGSYPFLWDHFVQFIYCSNFSSRFFLYIGCSQHFRYALRRLACLLKKKRRRDG